MFEVNTGDVVLQKLPCDLYVEIANRQEPITDKVWTMNDIKNFKMIGYKVQIEQSDRVLR